MMKESFLHFIWEFQFFNKEALQTREGESVDVLHQGFRNSNAGPDFYDARIKFGGIEWSGSIEIHINSSDWKRHRHQDDTAYNNVILHVVWQDDSPVTRADGTLVPTIELKNRIRSQMYEQYRKFLNSPGIIPCSVQFCQIPDIHKFSMFDRVLVERLNLKAGIIREMYIGNNNDMEETVWQLLAMNFGSKLNADPFLMLSKAVPLKLLRKHGSSLMQIEALLFGAAGMLNKDLRDDYPRWLKKEFQFLSQKYSLKMKMLEGHEWKFLRIRPAGFPTVKIASLAALIYKLPNLYSSLINVSTTKEAEELFDVEPSTYWKSHYVFDKPVDKGISGIGKSSVENVVINSIAPLLACTASLQDNSEMMEKALALLESTRAEDNRITRVYTGLGQNIANAFDSQACIQLYKDYCQRKRCLECNGGIYLMKQHQLVS